MTTTISVLTDEQIAHFERDGFVVARGLFSPDEAAQMREHFMAMHDAGPVEGYFNPLPLDATDGDILKHYPRIMHPHRWDATSEAYMFDARLESCLRDLFGEPVLAAQSMLYFKPPGARGQALHQDNFYLKVQPGTCMAAWCALDDADEDNGGLFAVPGSHRLDVLCPHEADLTKSFTVEEVDVPVGMAAVPVNLNAGDVLFFNGSTIHGSYPNTSLNRFRRAFICHYVPESTVEISDWYSLQNFHGEPVSRATSTWGGPCGTESTTGP